MNGCMSINIESTSKPFLIKNVGRRLLMCYTLYRKSNQVERII